jgi:hypothetical protein
VNGKSSGFVDTTDTDQKQSATSPKSPRPRVGHDRTPVISDAVRRRRVIGPRRARVTEVFDPTPAVVDLHGGD